MKDYTQALNQYSNLIWKLVNKNRWRYLPSTSMDDIYNIGVIGLIKAVDTYREDKRSKFFSWAYIKVSGEIIYQSRSDRRYPTYPVEMDKVKVASSIRNEEREEFRELWEAIENFPGDSKIITRYHCLNGESKVSQKRVASLLNTSEYSVKKNLSHFKTYVRANHPSLKELI